MKSFLFGDIRPEFEREEVLPDIFRDTCRARPDKVALIFGQEKISYQQLDRWSDLIASNLHKNKIGRGKIVACYLPRGLELHATILGILKSGAAYVTIDEEIPSERVHAITANSNACAIFTKKEFSGEILKFIPEVYREDFSEINFNTEIYPDDIAYVLYTSGSTGNPKGILISHRQICHLLRSEQSVLGINPADKVYQGFSVSFDMWLEETWISYLAGATLWVADAVTAKSLDELGEILSAQKITVLHAVPSLLSIINNNIPTLRIVNAGGEACNGAVAKRWLLEGRKLFNSYGPTETTVTATITELSENDEITIGKPLPNYAVAVVDENLNLVKDGGVGELVIAGPGVGVGYLHLENETAAKFIAKPESLNLLPGKKIYRTGDQAQITSEGNIRFLGRIDSQVKIRGYRIELGDIEAKLQMLPGVALAALAVKKPDGENDELIAYVRLISGANFDIVEAKNYLSKQLPPYMVPSHIVVVEKFVRLISGKIDMKSLPEVKTSNLDESPKILASMNISEKIITILKKIFPGQIINLSQDFFKDLGGHSLLAASFVSYLRNLAGFKSAAIRDIYSHRPLNKLAEFLEQSQKNITISAPKKADFYHPPKWKYFLCFIAQTLSLIVIYGFFALQIFLPYLAYYYVQQETDNHLLGIFSAIGFFCVVPPLFIIVGIISKWLIIGRYKAGNYPLWGCYYFRWWLTKTIQNLSMKQYLNSSPFYPFYLKMLGARVAATAQLSQFYIGAEDLVVIGRNVTISSGVNLNNAYVEDGMLKISSIIIKDHAYVGTSVTIGGNCKINRFGEISDLSYLPDNFVINEGELWRGSPAVKDRLKTPQERVEPKLPGKGQIVKAKIFFLLPLLMLPLVLLLPIAPGLIILNNIDTKLPAYDFSYLIYTPLIALLYTSLFILLNAIITRLMMCNIKPGNYPVYGLIYLRKWFADQIQEMSLFAVYPLYASVYTPLFMRFLGAKIGKGTEISTASNVTHKMLNLGKGAFIADAVMLGEYDMRNQQMILKNTAIGNNSFIGNSAVIPQGYEVPDNMLIGVLAVPPTKEQLAENPEAKDWFGSKAIPLPTRDLSIKFPDNLTNNPSFLRRIARAIVETIRIILPITALIIFSVIFIAFTDDLLRDNKISTIILLFPFYYLGLFALPVLLLMMILKWLIVGRYRCAQFPMWTHNVWRSEAITTLYEGLCVPFLLDYLKGTPWLPLALRLLGVKTGKAVWLNSTGITEFDMVKIGDNTAINHDSGPQTHLFEDRIMKIGKVEIGARVSLGCGAIILYDVKISDDVKIAPLSLVMKGERLESNTSWIGNPIAPSL